MTWYEMATAETVEVMKEVMRSYHPQLHDIGLRVDVLLAHANDDDAGPAIKNQGYACKAVIRKTSIKDRVKGLGDAELIIDGDKIDEWSDQELRALMDHELTHLELNYDKKGNLKTDDVGRPVLSIRLHDHQYGWFDAVARRWGTDSTEAQQAIAIAEDWEFVQLYLPGFDRNQLGTIRKEQLDESLDADEREQARADSRSHRAFVNQVGDLLDKAVAGTGMKVMRNVKV